VTHAFNPATQEVEIQKMLDKKLMKLHLNKLGMMVYACDPGYMGEIGRRIEVPDLPGTKKKITRPYPKTKVKRARGIA
jgi:hypothetical protein